MPDWFKFKGVVYITSTFDVNMVINGEQIEKKGQKDLIGLTSYINKMDKGDQLNITNIIIKRKLGNGKYRTYDMKPKPSIFKKIK